MIQSNHFDTDRFFIFIKGAITLILVFLAASGTQLVAQQKNILLIISDDLNTNIGPYMNIDEHTPHLNRLAKEGVRFTRAYSQFPLCGPSRASIMSGLYPESNGVLGNQHVSGSYRGTTPELADHPSMAGFFREQGYFTARVSKIFHMGVPGGIERGEAGDDDPDSWDFASNIMGPETLSPGVLEVLSPANPHYGSSFASMKIAEEFAETQTDYLAASQAIAILESRAASLAPNATNKVKIKAQSPFFLAVGLVRPHVPFIAPESCFEPYPDDEATVPKYVIGDNVPDEALRRRNERIGNMTETQKKKTISGYMASVQFMDQQVGRLLNALDRLDLRKETIVVFLSDHGYNLGEHDCWAKSSLWEGTVRVPLIIAHPDEEARKGAKTSTITELIDLYPTLADLCGISEQQPDILQGKSVASKIKATRQRIADRPAYSISYRGRSGSIRTDRWRYTRWGNDIEAANEELYDHYSDPDEHINLATDSDRQSVLNRLRKKFDEVRAKAKGKRGE